VPLLKRFSDALRQLFGSATPTAETAVQRAARLERKIRLLVDDMLAMPVTAVRALALIEDPDVALADLADLVRQDTALATVLLRVANSALYAGGTPALRIDQAVIRLGLWSCNNLITAVGVRQSVRARSPESEADCRALWRHGQVTASICTQLDRIYRLGFNGEEYAAGLLHDLGHILIALADRECLALAGVMDLRTDDPLARERAAIGIDHCALGSWFAELSSLPAPLVEVIRSHHTPECAPNVPRLAALVTSADHMAEHVQRGLAPASYDALDNPGLRRLTIDWAARRQEHLNAAIPAILEAAAAVGQEPDQG
jgi:HD-like signal output (HDOD) protein